MRTTCLSGIALLLLTGLAVAADARTEPDLAIVLVTGEQPGPALWKVSSGDHDLWLLGEVVPLPRKVQWRSRQFESLLANSQEVLLHNGARNVQGAQNAALARAGNLPGPLRNHVSAAHLAHIETVAHIYGVDEPLQDLNPRAAGTRIGNASLKTLDLRVFSLQASVQGLARKANVRITSYSPPQIPFEEYLEGVGDSANSLCLLDRTVQLLQDGGSGLRSLANAWAVGDIDALRRLVPEYGFFTDGSRSGICMKQAEEHLATRTAAWLAEAERALRENENTLAVVPIPELIATDGYLAALRARGYQVIEPE